MKVVLRVQVPTVPPMKGEQMLRFHEWKNIQVDDDSLESNVDRVFRPYEWYWKKYGHYVSEWHEANGIPEPQSDGMS